MIADRRILARDDDIALRQRIGGDFSRVQIGPG
jgi:hypothetical protein